MNSLSLMEVNRKASTLFQASTEQNVPSIDSPHNNMNALNDDCLRLIFDKIRRLRDFNPIIKVCRRFERIAHEIFPLKIRLVRFNRDTFGDEITLLRIEEFLRDFGSSVTQLHLDERQLRCINISDASNTVFKLIYKYCKNLKKLELIITGLRDETLTVIRPLLSELKYLCICLLEESHFGPFTEFVSACTQLETLRIFGWNNIFEFVLPAMHFPNLRDFIVIVPDMELDDFLLQNPQIENLEMYHSLELCRLIVDKLPNIRKLTLKIVKPNEIDSTALRYLMQFVVEMSIELDSSITNLFPIENITNLQIWLGNFSDESILIKLTRNLCNLKKLTIQVDRYREHKITTELLKKMLQFADQLKEFHIYPAFDSIYRFYERDYYDILDIVKRRANHKKLNIKIICRNSAFNSGAESFSGYKAKCIRFDMNPE